ncbi:MAG: cupin domain-containing protein [Tannerella sp.]|jgi:mannose-6-phosphate isomerase-like protein (cupin superfamily)|nr:cupin domain-containing protein [Tannerella sp.]
MKKIVKISEGANYEAISVGRYDGLGEHILVLGPDVEIPGKVFIGEALGSKSVEASFQLMPPGMAVPFLHTHDQNEELYIVIKGSGEFQVDEKQFAVGEGDVVKVLPKGKRSWRNTGSEPFIMLTLQYKEGSLTQSAMVDGNILEGEVKW